MAIISSLITPLLSNGLFWGGIIAALGVLAAWIYLNGRSSGKAAERQKALRQEIKDRGKYEQGYKNGLNMSDNERNEWVRKYQSKK